MEMVEINLTTIDSTNEYAKKNYLSFASDKITCIVAEEQTAGRGRWHKKWSSPKGVNIYATFCFQLPLSTPQLTTLAEVMAASLASVLIQEGLKPKVKWPNDIQLNDKKIAGILCETIFEKSYISIVLGIGINVNMEIEELSQIDQPASSLKIETQRLWDRKTLLYKLQLQFSKDLELFKKEGFAPFRPQLEKILAYKGETICCVEGEKEWIGICHSLSLDGGLNLLLESEAASVSPPRLQTIFYGSCVKRKMLF